MKNPTKPTAIAAVRRFPVIPVIFGSPAHDAGLSARDANTMARRGRWHLLHFLLISMVAFSVQDFDLFATVAEEFWPLLGAPPPAGLIHLALALYLITALILLPQRLSTPAAAPGWDHVAYRSCFYLFYLVAQLLPANFGAVLSGGLLLYGLEQAWLWWRILRGGPRAVAH